MQTFVDYWLLWFLWRPWLHDCVQCMPIHLCGCLLSALNTGREEVGDPVLASFLNAVHDHPFMRVLPARNTGGEQVGDPVPVSCLGAGKTMTVMKYFSWLHHAPNALFGCSCLLAHMYAFSVSRKLLSTVILSMSV